MAVDSFAFLPRSFRGEYETVANAPAEPVWTPLKKPLQDSTVALLTSAGLFLAGEQEPFDLDGERKNPLWGDPTYRIIPRDVSQEDIDASHLHLNTEDLRRDFNVALPIRALAELEAEGTIGRVADEHYSFMGYQDRGLQEWRDRYGPEVVEHLRAGAVDAVILAPA